jgi:hypothetical protein
MGLLAVKALRTNSLLVLRRQIQLLDDLLVFNRLRWRFCHALNFDAWQQSHCGGLNGRRRAVS